MNKIIKNNLNNYLSIFIILQPIIDLVTGLCLNIFNINLTIGIIIRMLFLISIMYITVFIYKKKHSLIYYLIFTLYAIMYLLGNIIFKDISIFSELQGLLRVFYFPLLLISLYDLKEEIRISKNTLIATLFIYLISIFIPILLNVGFNTYAITKSGTLGFYNSANEISGIISILTPFSLLLFTEKKRLILKCLFIILYLFVILSIGTKTPLLALLITIGMLLLWIMFNFFKEKKYKQIIISVLLVLIGSISLLIVVPKTNFYKNIQVHLDYLKIDSVLDVFEDEQLIDHFIFSERLTFYTDKSYIYKEANLYQKLFGIGYINDNKTTKLIEMDYYDIYFSHGLLGLIIFMSIPIYVLFKLALQKRIFDFEMYITNISFLLIVLLSFFTGHIITAPAVSMLAIVVILSLDCNKKKRLLFTANTLDMGGIETALVNLLNNINYEKYNVTVILEKREGIYLKEINDNVIVKELKVSNHKNKLLRKSINLSRKLLFSIFNYNAYDFSCCYATYSLSANKLARIASKNNSLYIHSNYRHTYNKNEFIDFFDNRNIYNFKHLIFVSNEAKNDFLEFYPMLKENCLVFNNFINPTKIKKLSEEKIKVSKNKNKKLFVFVGRLDDSSKKVKRAIKLISSLKNTELWIIGDGPDRKMYEKEVNKLKVKDRITFFGRKENPYPYMKEADYILLTSEYEGFPVTYLEAIVLKKKIITTIDVSDDKLNIGRDFATIIPKEEAAMLKKVKETLEKESKINEVDFDEIQKERLKKLEKIFDEVK